MNPLGIFVRGVMLIFLPSTSPLLLGVRAGLMGVTDELAVESLGVTETDEAVSGAVFSLTGLPVQFEREWVVL